MFKISEKIKIVCADSNSNRIFSNEQIYPYAKSNFNCCYCEFNNEIKITPYETGFGFFEIYNNEKVLTKEEIITNKIAKKSSPWATYLGEITVNDLPTLYFGTLCKKCYSNHLVVFCCGEKQPGLVLLEISGVWKYEKP